MTEYFAVSGMTVGPVPPHETRPGPISTTILVSNMGTEIPHLVLSAADSCDAALVLLASSGSPGPCLGAIFSLARELLFLVPLLQRTDEDPACLMDVLSTWRGRV